MVNIFSDAGIMRPGLLNQEDPSIINTHKFYWKKPCFFYLEEKFKLIQYKSETFTVKFCQKCRIFRALRAHHCKFCGVCVEEYDHHSQMISNCVGKRNKKCFLLMLWLGLLTIFEILLLSLYNLLDEKSRNDKSRVIYSLVFLALSSFLFFSIGMMLCLQMYLISNGMNTVEYFHGSYKKNSNPFNEGALKNWWNFLKRRRSHRTVDLKYLKAIDAEKNVEDSIGINLQSLNQ